MLLNEFKKKQEELGENGCLIDIWYGEQLAEFILKYGISYVSNNL